jgi:hypothetical protein
VKKSFIRSAPMGYIYAALDCQLPLVFPHSAPPLNFARKSASPKQVSAVRDIFISYVEEDGGIAEEVARGLEAAGYSTWYYQRDSAPGPAYLLQVLQAIEDCQAFVLIASPHAVKSHQVTKEVVKGHEYNKLFIPLLSDITDAGFKEKQPQWEMALGAATSVEIPDSGVSSVMPGVLRGLKISGIEPRPQEATGPLKAYVGSLESVRKSTDQSVTAPRPPSTAIPLGAWKKLLLPIAVAVLAVSGVVVGYVLRSGAGPQQEERRQQAAQPKLMTGLFNPHFVEMRDLSEWALPPSGWSIGQDQSLLIEAQPKLGYPREVYFGDFEMKFKLRLINEAGATWALRVKDPENYYLFHLTGPRSDAPGFFYTYIVRDGVLRYLAPDKTFSEAPKMVEGDEYSVWITAKGSSIAHRIKSAETPGSSDPMGEPLGEFSDADNNFPYGGIGFRTIQAEKFAIADLYVRPLEARKHNP